MKRVKDGQGRRHRAESIYATTSQEAKEITLSINSSTGDISFGAHMANTYSEVSYERASRPDKGPKVLARVPQGQSELTFDHERALLENFDFLCAVDTNTHIVNGRRVSVTGAVILRPSTCREREDLRYAWIVDVPFVIEIINLRESIKDENFGWLVAYREMAARRLVKAHARVGMIVDSDLGNLHEFNSRSLPVCLEYTLPQKVVLIYASADAGQENIANRAIAIADSVSSQTFTALRSGKLAEASLPSGNIYFDAYRVIEVDREDAS